MPVHRDNDGRIVDAPTQRVSAPTQQAQNSPQEGGRSGLVRNEDDPLEARTVRVGDSPNRSPGVARGRTPAGGDNEPHTRVVGGRRRTQDVARMEEAAAETDAMTDPVVGWLVIVEGPGKGNFLKLGYGANSIGKADTERVVIDFGDDQISRTNHAVVTYDPRGRNYFVQHGGGTNLTYLNDGPVLAPTELPALAHILLGNTTLRFVPLCGDAFDWQDTESSEDS